MCGIVGEISQDGIDISTFSSMRDELSHRGPDGAGLYTNETETVALGFRRLAIIDLSDAGMQPMANEDETVYLVFNGEIYNYRTLRDDLQSAGHEFTSQTDSEVILHGYEEWGVDVLDRLEGMFAFGIWDEQAERLFLGRDPFGIKPLHYYSTDDRFVFASELKAIVADETVPREISPAGLQSYLTYRYIPAPQTIWQGIKKIPPGHYLVYDGTEAEVTPYWNSSTYLDNKQIPEEQAVETLDETLKNSVRKHLVSDVPVGVLLSGGIDSSTVAALASKSQPGLSAYSMGFEGADDELEYARLVASEFDLDQTEEVLGPDELDGLLDEILYYYDEPLADSSIFPTFLLMSRVSQNLKVALAGDGGDELFAGYRWYDRYLRYKRLNPIAEVMRPLHKAIKTVNARAQSELMQSVEWRVQLASLTGLSQYQMAMHPPIESQWIDRIVSDELKSDSAEDVVTRYSAPSMNIKDLQHLDLNTFLPNDILVKVDRASMAHSLEVRVPLLDRSVAEYSLGLEEELIYKDNNKKHLLKQVARSYLPDRIVDRPKSGFGAPLQEMGFIDKYKEVLRESVAASDGVFEQEGLDEFLDADPPSNSLFKLILFELWYRRWAA